MSAKPARNPPSIATTSKEIKTVHCPQPLSPYTHANTTEMLATVPISGMRGRLRSELTA